MEHTADLEIFAAAPPGLEPQLASEVAELGWPDAQTASGGVAFRGDWAAVGRANLRLRCATKVLARVAAFRAPHLAQLDKRARRVDWSALLPAGAAVKVEATCKRSKIYHAGAAAQRVRTAIRDSLGPAHDEADPIRLHARIEDDLCVISVDTSGDPLHKRGFKQAVGKAPLRETMAAAFLRACGYQGDEPFLDPMCGSGTFVLEAAEIACGLAAGRGRSFALQRLKPFDQNAFAAERAPAANPAGAGVRFFGSDRDAGAVAAAASNAERAGVGDVCAFEARAAGDAAPPEGPAGLVMVNPPYGARIGDKAALRALYGSLGRALAERFAGWRVGLVTSEPALARATALPFAPSGPPIPHGPLKVRLYQTAPL